MSIIDDQIEQSVKYAIGIGVDRDEIDFDAAVNRQTLQECLGDRPLTDDVLLGVCLGAWAVQGLAESRASDDGEPLGVTYATFYQVVMADTMRKGLKFAAQFEPAQ